jgi:hypothetical protein
MLAVFCLWIVYANAPEINSARDKFSSGEYAKAALILENYLARDGLDKDLRLDALLLLGAANVGLGYVDSAKRKFAEALTLDPSTRGADFAPKIVRVIDAVRADLFPRPIISRAPTFIEDKHEKRLVIEVSLLIESAVTPTRPNGAPLELCTSECWPLQVRDGRAKLTLDLGEGPRGQLVWFVRTLDTREAVLGSPAEPERDLFVREVAVQPRLISSAPTSGPATTPVVVSEAKATPIYRRWWFWTPIALAVVGGLTTAVVFAARGPAEGPATLSWQVVESR